MGKSKEIMTSGKSTFPASSLIREFIGDTGAKQGVEMILQGKQWDKGPLTPTEDKWIQNLKYQTDTKGNIPIPMTSGITTEQFKNLM